MSLFITLPAVCFRTNGLFLYDIEMSILKRQKATLLCERDVFLQLGIN